MEELLQEFVDSDGASLRVDKHSGVLRGVKLIGLESRNKRRYRESALAKAVPLYENAKVNVNHPKDGPLKPRDYQDRLDEIRDVTIRSSEGLFGDLHFNPKHALAEQLAWDAEHNPRNVGFSHNVLAKLTREGDTMVVDEITRVQSVDLVADPAATLGLFEQVSSKQAELPLDQTEWDSLTLLSLRNHRPDLLIEYENSEVHDLRSQLEEATVSTNAAQRKQRIFELLHKHDLPIPDGKDAAGNQLVGGMFLETLMNATDDSTVESLIVERARLIREAADWRLRGGMRDVLPKSRDQTVVLATTDNRPKDAIDFARALKILAV